MVLRDKDQKIKGLISDARLPFNYRIWFKWEIIKTQTLDYCLHFRLKKKVLSSIQNFTCRGILPKTYCLCFQLPVYLVNRQGCEFQNGYKLKDDAVTLNVSSRIRLFWFESTLYFSKGIQNIKKTMYLNINNVYELFFFYKKDKTDIRGIIIVEYF